MEDFAQGEVLYNKALEYANLKGEETVIDAYCGTGTITLFLAQKAREVIGIEIVKPAIQDAQKNARDNNVRNAEFIVGDDTQVMPRLYKQGVRADMVVVDPLVLCRGFVNDAGTVKTREDGLSELINTP